MNRFTIGLLLLFVGLLVLAGGVWMVAYPWVDTAEWEFMHIVRNCLFGVFFVIAGPLLGFAACLEWRAAWDAQNLFGKRLTRDDYDEGTAIPYAEAPMEHSFNQWKKHPLAQNLEGASLLLPVPDSKACVRLLQTKKSKKKAAAHVEVLEEEGAAQVVYHEQPAAPEWQWYGVLQGNGWLPLQDTTLIYIWRSLGASAPHSRLRDVKANAVFFSDGVTLRVYPARQLPQVLRVLSQLKEIK